MFGHSAHLERFHQWQGGVTRQENPRDSRRKKTKVHDVCRYLHDQDHHVAEYEVRKTDERERVQTNANNASADQPASSTASEQQTQQQSAVTSKTGPATRTWQAVTTMPGQLPMTALSVLKAPPVETSVRSI